MMVAFGSQFARTEKISVSTFWKKKTVLSAVEGVLKTDEKRSE